MQQCCQLDIGFDYDYRKRTLSQSYFSSALHVDSPEKKAQETFSLRNTGDFFRKIIVLDGNSKLWTDEDGVTYIGVIPFLLEDMLSYLL